MDLEKICHASGVPVATLARELFPEHRYPQHALKNSAKAKRGLTSDQTAKVVQLTGLTEVELRRISNLPDTQTPPRNGWSWRPEALKQVFFKGKYRVDYYSATNVAYLYRDSELVSDHILVAQTITLKAFLLDMESLIASSEA